MAAGDLTIRHGATGTWTITPASLASSSTKVAGRESTAIALTEPMVDVLVGGKITVGTTPTAGKSIDVWVYAGVNDTPLYPDVMDGTDSAETLTSENVRNAAMRLGCSLIVDSTSDRTYWIAPFSVAALFGGVLPTDFGLFVVHDTVAALHATGGNHALYYTPVYLFQAQS